MESHDQAIFDQMRNSSGHYYAHKGPSQTDIQSYANYSNSENVKSEKNKENKDGYSALSNRQKIPNIEKSVPIGEISLRGAIAETVPSELKNIPKILNSPTKQQFPNTTNPTKKGSPAKQSQLFNKSAVSQSGSKK